LFGAPRVERSSSETSERFNLSLELATTISDLANLPSSVPKT
jgi:hypothetical protein